MGRVPPFFSRSTSSLASSTMVISAARSVSKTALKPRRRRAETILPLTLVPMGRSKASPRVTRMEGAVWTTTCLWGSERARQTSLVLSFSAMAPVGQTTMHCPQETQATSPRFCSKAQPMWVAKPRSLGPITPTDCHFWQAATHRRQRTHLSLSRNICFAVSSKSCWGFSPA